MDVFLEVVGVVLLAVTYFLLQTYTSKKTRIPSKLNNPELIPIIENQNDNENELDRVSFEDLVDEMTSDGSESESDDFNNQIDDETEEIFSPNGSQDYSKLEKEVIRLSQIVENLDKKVHGKEHKKSFSPKNIFQNTNALKSVFIVSEVLKPKFNSEH